MRNLYITDGKGHNRTVTEAKYNGKFKPLGYKLLHFVDAEGNAVDADGKKIKPEGNVDSSEKIKEHPLYAEYADMKNDDLKEIFKEKGIELPKKQSKTDLLTALLPALQ